MSGQFIPGRQKFRIRGGKCYCATLTWFGSTRYSKRARFCRTATQALRYAERWAQRADRLIGGEHDETGL